MGIGKSRIRNQITATHPIYLQPNAGEVINTGANGIISWITDSVIGFAYVTEPGSMLEGKDKLLPDGPKWDVQVYRLSQAQAKYLRIAQIKDMGT
jgi:hypothetical protein